jgi:hypothetical protein
MPNWVKNIIITDQVDYQKYAVNNDKVDFNILIPEPKEISLTRSPSPKADPVIQKQDCALVIKCRDSKQFIDIVSKRYKLTLSGAPYEIKSEYTQDDIDKLDAIATDESRKILEVIHYLFGTYCLYKYGSDNWYDWRRQYWGCKWNASDSTDNGKEFQTPWSAPEPWYRELAKKINFIALYADEDIGSNCGIYVGRNKDLDHYCSDFIDINSEAFARAIWGYIDSDSIDEDIESAADINRADQLKHLKADPKKFLQDYLVDIYLPSEYDEKVIGTLESYL